MEVMLGALPSLLPKLGELLADEYNLQKEVKGGIRFLQAELETMKAALEDISKTPADQIPNLDKIWARNVRELSYDIEDNIDTFMVQVRSHQADKNHGFKKFIDKALGSLMQPKIRRKIAIDIRDIKSRVVEVHDRRRRYKVNHSVDKPVKVDPLALVAMVRYKNPKELVGIEESRDEVIKILIEGNEASKEQKKIVSIVGFGGLGKTTLANAMYEKLRVQFDCSAFVSVSQTPGMYRLFKGMLSQLANKDSTASIDVIIDELRGFLREKRYGYIKKNSH
jgi:ATP-dependent Lon protease